jgi:hypothetical protein
MDELINEIALHVIEHQFAFKKNEMLVFEISQT